MTLFQGRIVYTLFCGARFTQMRDIKSFLEIDTLPEPALPQKYLYQNSYELACQFPTSQVACDGDHLEQLLFLKFTKMDIHGGVVCLFWSKRDLRR